MGAGRCRVQKNAIPWERVVIDVSSAQVPGVAPIVFHPRDGPGVPPRERNASLNPTEAAGSLNLEKRPSIESHHGRCGLTNCKTTAVEDLRCEVRSCGYREVFPPPHAVHTYFSVPLCSPFACPELNSTQASLAFPGIAIGAG